MIRILLAEDQALVRSALAALLRLEPDFEVVAEAANGLEAVAQARRLQPDIAVLDIEMPGLDGIAATAELSRYCPSCRAVILTTFARGGYLARAVKAGAKGYMLKESPAERLAAAIRSIHAGGRAIDSELAVEAVENPNPLTYREQQILTLAANGAATAAIAEKLSLSEGTVRNYLSEAIAKTGAANRVEAANIARDQGWL